MYTCLMLITYEFLKTWAYQTKSYCCKRFYFKFFLTVLIILSYFPIMNNLIWTSFQSVNWQGFKSKVCAILCYQHQIIVIIVILDLLTHILKFNTESFLHLYLEWFYLSIIINNRICTYVYEVHTRLVVVMCCKLCFKFGCWCLFYNKM